MYRLVLTKLISKQSIARNKAILVDIGELIGQLINSGRLTAWQLDVDIVRISETAPLRILPIFFREIANLKIFIMQNIRHTAASAVE